MADQETTLGTVAMIVLVNAMPGTLIATRRENVSAREIATGSETVTGIAEVQTSVIDIPGMIVGTIGHDTPTPAGRRLMNDTMNRDQTLVALGHRHGIGIPSLISMPRHRCVLWTIVDHHPLILMALVPLKSDQLNLVFIDLMTVLRILVHIVL